MTQKQFLEAIEIISAKNDVKLTINPPLEDGFCGYDYRITIHKCSHSVIENLMDANFLTHLRPNGIEVSKIGEC